MNILFSLTVLFFRWTVNNSGQSTLASLPMIGFDDNMVQSVADNHFHLPPPLPPPMNGHSMDIPINKPVNTLAFILLE